MAKLSRGNRNIRWIEEFCRIPEGSDMGQPVRLRAWQKRIIKGIYDTPTRQAIVSYGKKNGKTALAGFLLCLHIAGPEAVPNSQLYSAAQSRDQAAILFALAAKVVRLSPDLHAVIGIRESAKQLYCDELGTVYRALSAESTTAHGVSPAFVVHDELGEVRGPRFALYDAIEDSMAAHESPLSIVISTQAADDADLLSVLIDDAKAGNDPEVKLWLFEAAKDVDPFSVKALRQANPAYGDFNKSKELRRKAAAAKRMPSKEAKYRNYTLNQRVAAVARFVPQSVWAENGADPRPADFANGITMGVDLSERLDLTALVYVGKGDDGCFSVGCEFFAPEHGVNDRAYRDRVPYDVWAQQGFLTLTPGKSVGYDFVGLRIMELYEQYGLEELRFDRWKIDKLQRELQLLDAPELPFKPHGQGFKDMSPALDALETELIETRLRHGNHPILTWNAANAAVDMDPAKNRKLNKVRSTGRIDGMVSLAMAVAGATLGAEAVESSPWNDENYRMHG